MNLKFRGLPELLELNSNLKLALALWLALILSLDDEVAPTILNAYRVSPASAAKPNFPQDVIAIFSTIAQKRLFYKPHNK